MTRTVLLERLRDLTEEATAGVLLPVRRQKGDGESLMPRPAKIYLMGLPEAGAAVKKAPYILHQIVTGKDTQKPGDFQLDLSAGLDTLVYPDDTAPYYIGEVVSTWKLPGITRKVD